MDDITLIRILDGINKRQDAIRDMLSSFMKIYAKDNNHAIESVEQECEYINDVEEFNR